MCKVFPIRFFFYFFILCFVYVLILNNEEKPQMLDLWFLLCFCKVILAGFCMLTCIWLNCYYSYGNMGITQLWMLPWAQADDEQFWQNFYEANRRYVHILCGNIFLTCETTWKANKRPTLVNELAQRILMILYDEGNVE